MRLAPTLALLLTLLGSASRSHGAVPGARPADASPRATTIPDAPLVERAATVSA